MKESVSHVASIVWRMGWILGLAGFCLGPVHALNTCTNNGLWENAAIWNGGVPADGQDVLIPAGKTVTVSSATFVLNSLTNNGTLIFTNWTTKLTAGEVTINGIVTLPAAYTNAEMSNRVWIACTNLTVMAGGQIDVKGRGYRGGAGTSGWGQGPAGGTCSSYYGGGGGHGGAAGDGTHGTGGGEYDSTNQPMMPGSGGGGNLSGAGGGPSGWRWPPPRRFRG